MSDRFHDAFREEALEILGELETALLEMEKRPDERGLVDRVFRALHTIKGSGSMFGFAEVSSFTHEVETVFDLVRRGEAPVTRELVDMTLAARDLIREMLAPGSDAETGRQSRAELLSRFRGYLPAAGSVPGVKTAVKADAKGLEKRSRVATYRIRFKPATDILKHGTNPVRLLRELRGLGDCRIVAHLDEVPRLAELDPELCAMSWDIVLTTAKNPEEIRGVFLFVEDDSRISIDALGHPAAAEEGGEEIRVGEILVERGDITPTDLESVLSSKKRVGEILVERGLVSKDEVRSVLAEQQHLREMRESRDREESSLSIRIRAAKLDGLMGIVREMEALGADFSRMAGELNDSRLVPVSRRTALLLSKLHDAAMNLRMLPIASVFSAFRRLVRDLCAKKGKTVELIADGGETELDKNVIEKLTDPVMRIIRNTVDYGIETPEIRRKTGKPAKAVIRLSAGLSETGVVLRISDDGSGRAEEMPGVRRSISKLGGSMEVEAVKDQGTSISVLLPLEPRESKTESHTRF